MAGIVVDRSISGALASRLGADATSLAAIEALHHDLRSPQPAAKHQIAVREVEFAPRAGRATDTQARDVQSDVRRDRGLHHDVCAGTWSRSPGSSADARSSSPELRARVRSICARSRCGSRRAPCSASSIRARYGVHRSSAARWVTAAHQETGTGIRAALATRLNIREPGGLIVALVTSRVEA